MKKMFPVILTGLVLALNLFSQTPAPTATPNNRDDVVKISTDLIQVDVTVTDRKGQIIRDIKREEIEIYENGKKQPLTNFSFVSAPRVRSENAPTAENRNVAVPPPSVRPANTRRTIAIVVDDLTLSHESTVFARRALKKFVDEQMQSGDLVAIIRTAGGIGALQQFTNDPRQLYAAIEKVKWNPAGSGLVGAFVPIEMSALEQATSKGAQVTPKQIQADRDFREESEEARRDAFAIGTLGAIDFIVRGMDDLPGRKSIMLLSDGFKLFRKESGGFKSSGVLLDNLRRLVDVANRASVVVNTVDARGLQIPLLGANDNVSGMTPNELQNRISDRQNQMIDTQDGLRYLAEQTGGRSIANTNDLSDGLRQILDDQSYYLIGYQPDDETFDPKERRFNKLEVKVTRPGANVRYRSGFFGISDVEFRKTTAALSVADQIKNALVSPFSVSDIALRLNTIFESDGKQGASITSLLHVDAKALKFTDEPNGIKKTVLNIVAVSFGDNGQPADQISRTYTFTLKPDTYDKIMRDGFVYNFTFPVKKPGGYQLRVALHDEQSGRVGSANQYIEVPNLKKERLTLSGVVLENKTLAQWQNRATNNSAGAANSGGEPAGDQSNFMNATSLRRFKRGTILIFGSKIYNSRFDKSQNPNLSAQMRVLRDGKVILGGDASPVAAAIQKSGADAGAPPRLQTVGAFALGAEMEPGEYVLQIIVTDNLAEEKRKVATQFIQFELVGQ